MENLTDLWATYQPLLGFIGVNGTYDFPTVPQRGVGEHEAVVTKWNPAARTWQPVSLAGGVPPKS